jgi:hypothetical protein
MMRSFLDCSSGHLCKDTWTWLDTQFADDALRDPSNSNSALLGGGKTRYGWFVYASEDFADGIPDDLQHVCRRARASGAEYILFDCDAPPDPALTILHPDFTTDT